MRAFLIVTASVFGLIVVVHVWRALEEGPHVATEPSFVLATVIAAGLCLWACRLLRQRG